MSDEPKRTWIYKPKLYYPPNYANQIVASGIRNDGQEFSACVRFPPEHESDARRALLQKMDTFLDPRCECVVGKNCSLHSDIEAA